MKENKANSLTDRIIKVDVNDYNGNLLERWKTKVNNKHVGRRIILRLKELFNLGLNDLKEEEKLDMNEELELQKKLSS